MSSLSDDEEDDQVSGADAEFLDDMEDPRKMCLPTGASIDNAVPRSFDAAASSPSASASASATRDGDSDSEDDLELLRKLQRRFCDSVDSCEAAMYENPTSLGPAVLEEDETEDYETLCAVRNRFAAYEANELQDVLSEPGSEPFVEQNDVELVPSYLSFPKEARLLVDAIKRNRSFQKFLRSKMAHIGARMEENRKLVERVKILKDFQGKCKRVAGDAFSIEQDPRIRLITAQKLNYKGGSAKCKGPVENSHVAKYRSAVPHFPLSWKQKPWSKVERENLNKGLRQLFQETLFQASMNQSSESGGSPGDPSNLDGIASAIRHLEITHEQLREFIPKVNWDQLASSIPGRSGAECEARWLNFEDPLINQSPWTKQEEKLILLIVQERGMTNWIDIATFLGTNRTPFDCLAHFQRSLNAYILKREWTSEEDDQLRAAVQVLGESNWQHVAATLPGRTGPQCSNRWLKSIHPSLSRKGRWTVDEDKRLKVAVKLFGPKNWEKIAQFVPGRRQSQCRERWVNSLDPSLKRGEWTEEEDSKLKAGIEDFGHCWSKIAAKYLPHRTDNLCLRRWKVLFPDDVRSVQAARRLKKAALRSNFVDNEEYRPALGVSDFIPLPMITSGTEPGNTVPAKRRKRKSRELNNSTAEENGDAVGPPGKGAKKRRLKRPTEKVEVSFEEAGAMVACTEVENTGSHEEYRPALGISDFIQLPKITSVTEPGNTVPAKRRKRKSRELNNSTAEENGDAVGPPGKGAKKRTLKRPTKKVEVSFEEAGAMVACTEVENTGSHEEYRPALGVSDFIQLPKITSGTEPGNTVPAKRRKRKSRELNNSTAEENGDAVVPPGEGAKKRRLKRPTKKVEVSFEEAGAMVAKSTEVENTGSRDDLAMVVAEDMNAETCPHPIQNGVSDNRLLHHPRPTQTTQENAGELSMVHLISCEPVNLEEHAP